MRARYYSPRLGRFLTEDSAMDGENWYIYAANNPVKYNDPTGHWVNIAIGAAIGAGAGFLGSIIADKVAGREIDWKGAGVSAAVGAGTGALAGLTFGASLAVTGTAVTARTVGTNVAINTAGSVVEQGIRTGSVDPVQTASVAGLSAVPFGVGKIVSSSGARSVNKLAAPNIKAGGVHGNSAQSTKIQHGYEIFDKQSGDVVKTGISGQNLNLNGTSPRANVQVNAWNKDAGFDQYAARVVKTGMPNRTSALNWEANNASMLKNAGNSMNRHIRPAPWR